MSPPPARTELAFDASRIRDAACNLVVARRTAAGVELDFGQRAPALSGATGQQAQLQQRMQLPLTAARHLEDALVRVLDALQAPPAR